MGIRKIEEMYLIIVVLLIFIKGNIGYVLILIGIDQLITLNSMKSENKYINSKQINIDQISKLEIGMRNSKGQCVRTTVKHSKNQAILILFLSFHGKQ